MTVHLLIYCLVQFPISEIPTTLNITGLTSRFQVVALCLTLNTRTPLRPGLFSFVFEPPNYRVSHVVNTNGPLVIVNKLVAKRWPSFLTIVACD